MLSIVEAMPELAAMTSSKTASQSTEQHCRSNSIKAPRSSSVVKRCLGLKTVLAQIAAMIAAIIVRVRCEARWRDPVPGPVIAVVW
jgi:hypothetical protein